MKSTDRIEKQVTLRAPVSRVWRAIADAQEFGRWFGFTLEGAFTPELLRVGDGAPDARHRRPQRHLLLDPVGRCHGRRHLQPPGCTVAPPRPTCNRSFAHFHDPSHGGQFVQAGARAAG